MGAHEKATFPDEVRLALDGFRRIVQTLRNASRDAEQRLGLSAAQLFALQQLAAAPGTSVNELAARTFTHQSSVSVVVRRLVAKRLVLKVTAREDRRRVRLAVTEAGRALLRRSPEPVQERLIATLASFSARERQTLARALVNIADAMSSSAQPAAMFFEDGAGARRRKPAAKPESRSRSARRTRR